MADDAFRVFANVQQTSFVAIFFLIALLASHLNWTSAEYLYLFLYTA